MNARFSTQARNSATCKDKWGVLPRDFKKIYEYKIGTGNNQNYWSMNMEEKLAQGLLRNFGQGLYEMIVEFLGT
jgi:hypothetical protein